MGSVLLQAMRDKDNDLQIEDGALHMIQEAFAKSVLSLLKQAEVFTLRAGRTIVQESDVKKAQALLRNMD